VGDVYLPRIPAKRYAIDFRRTEHSQAETGLGELAEIGWDGVALKKAVLKSQQDRSIVRSIKDHGSAPHWDYEPVETGPYDPLSDFTAGWR
jgi:hypothetical protein